MDELEFLELSVREDDPERDAKVQAELDDFLEKLGLLGDVVTDMKTQTVLEHLVNRGVREAGEETAFRRRRLAPAVPHRPSGECSRWLRSATRRGWHQEGLG